MRLQGDRKGNTIWNFQSAKWKCRQRPEEGSPSTLQLYIYLKLVIWYSRRMRSRSLISWNLSLSSWVTVPTPSGLQISNVHGYHWNWIYRPGIFLLAFKTDHIDLMEKRGKVFFFFFFFWGGDWDDVHKQTRGCITHEWNRYSSRTYIQTNQPQETKRKERINQLNPSKDDRRRWSDLSRLHNSTTNQDKSCNSNNWTNAKLIQDKHVWLEELHTTIHIYI
jgi:hypothetical protein